MPNRGAVLPWRVTFAWSNRVKGAKAFYSEEEARGFMQGQQALARRNAQDGRSPAGVESSLWHRGPDGKYGPA